MNMYFIISETSLGYKRRKPIIKYTVQQTVTKCTVLCILSQSQNIIKMKKGQQKTATVSGERNFLFSVVIIVQNSSWKQELINHQHIINSSICYSHYFQPKSQLNETMSGILIVYTRRFGTLRDATKYRKVAVKCSNCITMLFQYKKKNGTKSGLVKLYRERIVDDPYCLNETTEEGESELICPNCGSQWGRHGNVKGHPVFRCIGGKLQF